jgi:hypothetical protein
MKLFVGIDVSSQSLDVCFLDSDSNVLHQGYSCPMTSTELQRSKS